MVNHFLFKDRDGQTPLPKDLRKGLKIRTIQTIGELDEYEEDNIFKGLNWLEGQSANPISYDFWLKLHKRLFANVWNWAGKVRTHELNNPDFLEPHEIWTELYTLEENLKTWISEAVYSEKELVARFHERMLTIHPFANGNGRFSRILAENFCKYQGYQIPSWGKGLSASPSERRNKYIDSLIHARRERDYVSLVEFIFS